MKILDRAARIVGLLSLVPVLGLPLSNPDLFWHLSAARRIRELGALPAADWLSSTRAGAPWTDFEWVSQLLFDALHRGGGIAALWAFKAAVMAASAFILLKTLELYTDAPAPRNAALALWSAASLTRSDIRPELFSLLGFGLVFLALERRRLGLKVPGPLACALLFCAWSNLHPGFVYGLALIGLYAAGEAADAPRPARAPSLWGVLAAAAGGALIQAGGLANLEVIGRHWKDMAGISPLILEWKGVRLDDPWHWPFWIALFSAFGSALLLLRRRRRVPLGPLAAVLFFGFTASRHARLAAYFATLAIPLIVAFLAAAGVSFAAPARRRLQAALAAAFASFALACSLKYGLGRTLFNDHFLPRRAAEFLAAREDLSRLTLYNPWRWGGYLGWRLYPRYRVFQDGRYIFHDLLQEGAAALESPASWARFLEGHGVELALMENAPLEVDGRPYYLAYMPDADWELLYRDEKALLFARRRALPRP